VLTQQQTLREVLWFVVKVLAGKSQILEAVRAEDTQEVLTAANEERLCVLIFSKVLGKAKGWGQATDNILLAR